jgi:prephenate dehydrogenase
MSALPASVAVFGPGLMGGSLLMALRQRAPQMKLGAWARRAEVIAELKSQQLIDFGGTDAAEVAAACGMVVLCLPVDRLDDAAESIKEAVSPATWVTDVGSVKQSVVASLEKIFATHGNFVGSHPMCGSEEAGLGAARADLYEGALCVVTPTENSNPDAVCAVSALWQAVGARLLEMNAADHDRAAAAVSHVPHVAAALLVELVCGEAPIYRQLCAGGFRDTTRVASGSPDLWAAILSSNRAEVSSALGKFSGLIAELRQAVENNDTDALRDFLARASRHRAEILSAS